MENTQAMKNIAVKLEITNSRNDDRRIRWRFFDTEEEAEAWKEEMRKEQHEWNYNTDGAVSTRWYSFTDYLKENILHTDMSELEGMTVGEFITLLHGFSGFGKDLAPTGDDDLKTHL